jgi:hypothetical protein
MGRQFNGTLLVDHPDASPNLPARRNFSGGSQFTESGTVRTGPSQLGPVRPKARKNEKGSRG